MPTTWKAWTSKEIARLEKMRSEGCSRKAIAAELGRTVGAVARKIADLNLPWWSALSLRWVHQYEINPSPTVAAKVFGVSIWSAKKWKTRLRKAGFIVPGQY